MGRVFSIECWKSWIYMWENEPDPLLHATRKNWDDHTSKLKAKTIKFLGENQKISLQPCVRQSLLLDDNKKP